MRILLDVDEVLADFCGGVYQLWGVERLLVEELWEPGLWGVIPPLSAALGLLHPMSDDEFWTPINKNPDFWADLEVLPWAWRILEKVQATTDDWWLVTAPSLCESSYVGKHRWIIKHLPKNLRKLIPTGQKYLLANPETLLIDDSDSNINQFRAAGGRGILFPRLHNNLHAIRTDAVSYVEAQLDFWSNKNAPDFKERERRLRNAGERFLG